MFVRRAGALAAVIVALTLTVIVPASAATSVSPAAPARAAPSYYVQLAVDEALAEVTAPSKPGAVDDPSRDLRFTCIPGNIDAAGNRSAWTQDVTVDAGGTVAGARITSGEGGGTVSTCQGSLSGSIAVSSGSVSLTGSSTHTLTVPTGSAKGSSTWTTSYTITRSGTGPIGLFSEVEAEMDFTVQRSDTYGGGTTSYSGKASVALLLTAPGTAGGTTVRVGLACDTKALDGDGVLACTAAAEGVTLGSALEYSWKVDGAPQVAGVTTTATGSRLDLTGIPRGATRRISVSVRDPASGALSAPEEVTLTRPAVAGGSTSGGGLGATPVIVVAGVAVAVALAVAVLRTQRGRGPAPQPLAAPPAAPSAAQPARSASGLRLVVRIDAATSVLTRGRYADGRLRIMGDEADVAQLRCTCHAEPASAHVVGEPSISWAISYGTGQLQPGWSMTDRFDLVTGGHPASAILRADWADQHEWLQVTATVTATVTGADGTTVSATGVASQDYVVIGATPVAQLEASPGPVIDLDGTTIVEIVPSLYLFDALFPGEVDLVELPVVDPTRVGPVPTLRGAETGIGADPTTKVLRHLELLTSLPSTRGRFRSRLQLGAWDEDLRLAATVRARDRVLVPTSASGAVDPIVNRHIETCVARVGLVLTEPLALKLRATRVRLEAVDPALPADRVETCSSVACLRLRLMRADGHDIDDQDISLDLPADVRSVWSITYRFAHKVNRCAPDLDDPTSDRYVIQVALRTGATVRGGCLTTTDPTRPAAYDDRDILYDHLRQFREPRFTPMRGDRGRVEAEANVGGGGSPRAEIAIRVMSWDDACRYVDTTYRTYDASGRPIGVDIANRDTDRQLVWYRSNAVPEDYFKLLDYANLDHEFYPDGTPDPQRLRREPCSDSPDYYCHDFAWRPLGRTEPAAPRILDSEVFDIAAAGYDELWIWQSLQPGDVVTFEDDAKDPPAPAHSAVVDHVVGGEVWLRSKDRKNSVFVHKLTKDVSTDWFTKEFGRVKLRYFRPRRSTLGL